MLPDHNHKTNDPYKFVDQASFLDVRKKTQGGKNSKLKKKLKTQAKNSESRHFSLKKAGFIFFITYSLVKIIGFANANVCCNNKLGYSSSLQSTIKSSLGGSCVLPMDPEHKLKKKLKKKLKNSSIKLKTQAKNSKSRHFLDRCLPEMRSKRKPGLINHECRY